MERSLWESTLAEFRDELATTAPAPAGVSIAVVSGVFALSLLIKTLEISAKKTGFRVEETISNAHAFSGQLREFADRDAEAFKGYLRALRLPKETSEETLIRAETIRVALGVTIVFPLAAARCACTGLALCADALLLADPVVVPDVGAAAALLEGAIRAILVSVDFNLRSLPSDDQMRPKWVRERNSIQVEASRMADKILRRMNAS